MIKASDRSVKISDPTAEDVETPNPFLRTIGDDMTQSARQLALLAFALVAMSRDAVAATTQTVAADLGAKTVCVVAFMSSGYPDLGIGGFTPAAPMDGIEYSLKTSSPAYKSLLTMLPKAGSPLSAANRNAKPYPHNWYPEKPYAMSIAGTMHRAHGAPVTNVMSIAPSNAADRARCANVDGKHHAYFEEA